jgi:hypothetical protein
MPATSPTERWQPHGSEDNRADEGGQGSSKDIEAGDGDGDVNCKRQQQLVRVRGSSSSPRGLRTLVVPNYGGATEEGGSAEEERRNKSYDNLYTRIFLVMDEPNWK